MFEHRSGIPGTTPTATTSDRGTPSAGASEALSDEPTPGPTAVATIPMDCHALVPASEYDRLFGATPLQQLRPVPAGSSSDPIPSPSSAPFLGRASLYCIWKDPNSDVSGLTTGVGAASQADLDAYHATIEAQGYSCSAVEGGTSCQLRQKLEQYGVERTTTFFVRGTTWVEIDQTNFPTNNLLGAIVSTIWS